MDMKLLFPLAYLFSCAFLAAGCNSGNDNTEGVAQTKEITLEQNQDYAPADTVSQSAPPAPPAPEQEALPVVKTDWDKKIVKTATLQAEVKDFALFSKGLAQKVKALGGYTSQEQQNQSEYRIENAVTIKVPVQQFDQAVDVLLKDVEQVDTRQISSEDVTSAYIDSKSRLEAKKQVRQRYLELLKSARNMSDILEVQKEINSIQEEIEMVTGRINYLGHASAMSTIHLTFYQVIGTAQPGRGVPEYLEQLKDSFANGWYWLGELLLGLVAIWPLVLLLLLIGLLIRKKQVLRTR
jgi:hypothetical protein